MRRQRATGVLYYINAAISSVAIILTFALVLYLFRAWEGPPDQFRGAWPLMLFVNAPHATLLLLAYLFRRWLLAGLVICAGSVLIISFAALMYVESFLRDFHMLNLFLLWAVPGYQLFGVFITLVVSLVLRKIEASRLGAATPAAVGNSWG